MALLLTNSIEFVTAYLAALHAGHIVMPLDPAYKKLELDAIIARIQPALLVTSERYFGQINRSAVKTIKAEDIKPEATRKKPLRLTAETQLSCLIFTSGTSGVPKAAPNTHANHIWNVVACSKIWDWTPKDTILINIPLSHMHGIAVCLPAALYHGNTVYLFQQSFNAKAILEELSSGRISIFPHGPIAYSKLLDQPGDYDLSRVRLCISGSAPLPPAVWQGFKDRFGVEIVETYGSSETGRIAGNRLNKKVIGSPGPPLPGVQLKISAENELLVKSPGVFPGYYSNPGATAAGFTDDGYWRTGDFVELKEGNIFLKGRMQERIRRFGYTVSPRDVEWALRQNPAIEDVFVLGRQVASQANDTLVCFVVSQLDEKELREYCQDNLLFAWRPDKIVYLDKLPKTHSGKTRISALKSMLEKQPAGSRGQ